MNARPETAAWWVFFPFKGLDVTDDEPALDEPIFGDATIISKRHVRQIVRLLRLNERMESGHDHEADTIYMLENATFREDFHSFIVVRRTGSEHLFDAEPREAEEPHPWGALQDAAEKRAAKIAALVELVVLSQNRRWAAPALVRQIHRFQQNTVTLSIETGRVGYFRGGGFSHTALGEPLRLSRDDLLQRLREEQVRALSTTLMAQRAAIGGSLARAIAEAAIRLSDALHTPTAAGQLLGSVTAIEILITEQGDSFETIRRRIGTLIGVEPSGFYEVGRVLNERHIYVHRGIDPTPGLGTIKATALALSCLLRYAELAHALPSKSSLLRYLDFLYAGDRMRNDWEAAEVRSFELLKRHNTKRHSFPFFAQ